MVTSASTSASLKEYLKKYESNPEEEKKKKKKKNKTKAVAPGVLVVDQDPVWQKPVNLEEDEENDSPDEKPLVDEDIEVKRMRRLEQLRAQRAYNQISEDGSGWVSVSDAPKGSTSADPGVDISSRRKRTMRYDTPSPDNRLNPSGSGREDADLSPPRQHRRRNDSPSPEPEHKSSGYQREGSDLSPPRQRRRCYDSPSPESGDRGADLGRESDLSPPRRRGRSSGSPSVLGKNPSISGVEDTDLGDLSPPRRVRPSSPKFNASRDSEDLSPPRKSRKGISKMGLDENGSQQTSKEADLSPPRKRKSQLKTGLITGKDVSEEIAKTKKDEWLRFKGMDASTSGQGAEPVYRIKGERVSKEEYLKLTKKEEKPKEKKLEWGKGLAQKREAEARLLELELEKDKPFARSRDDPDLDRIMRDRLRWGDPMAHLVKRKQSDLALPDLGENEKMKESGFIIPQDIPIHSWMKRGLDYEPNRYGIKPGRHWDGVDRSNGHERQLFKRMNEKRATEREAYLWSVSDM